MINNSVKCWILTTIFFKTVFADNWGLIHFSKSKARLAKCLEDSEAWNFLDFEVHPTAKKSIVNTFARSFYEETVSKENFYVEVARVTDQLFINRNVDLRNHQTLRAQIKSIFEKALLNCSDDRENQKINSTESMNYQDLPYFVEEPSVLGLLLDYILVNWPCLREHMLSTQCRFDTLQKFVEDSLEILDRVYSTYGEAYDLHHYLRLFWWRRADFFFDGRDNLYPYINHIYSEDYNRPYTRGDMRIYINRWSNIFADRSPEIPQSYLNRLLNIRPTDPSSDRASYVVSHYIPNLLASYYFEFHVTQFFRILLVVLELKENGLTSGSKDPKFKDTVELLHNDSAYSNYLLNKKYQEIRLAGSNDSEFRRHLEKNTQVSDLDLVMLFWARIKNQGKTMTTSNSTTSAVSSNVFTSTTPAYKESNKGKGKLIRVTSGKCFLLKHETGYNVDKGCENIYDNPSTSNTKISSDTKANDKYCGYITYIGDDFQDLSLISAMNQYSYLKH